jgi:hypothetical protein
MKDTPVLDESQPINNTGLRAVRPVVSFLATSGLCDFQNLALGEIVKTPLIVGTYQTCADVTPADPVKMRSVSSTKGCPAIHRVVGIALPSADKT